MEQQHRSPQNSRDDFCRLRVLTGHSQLYVKLNLQDKWLIAVLWLCYVMCITGLMYGIKLGWVKWLDTLPLGPDQPPPPVG